MENWIHINPNSGQGNDTIEITVDANSSSEDRSTTIDVKTSTLNKILSIIQKGADMANIIAFYLPNGETSGAKVFFNNEENTFPAMYNALRSEVQYQEGPGRLVINPYEIYIVKYSSGNYIVYKVTNYKINSSNVILDIFDTYDDFSSNQAKLVEYEFTASGIQLMDTDMYEITLSSYSLNKTQVMSFIANELNMSLPDVKYYFDNQLPIPVLGEEKANEVAEGIETSFSNITCTVNKKTN